jgi:hypothetical protein
MRDRAAERGAISSRVLAHLLTGSGPYAGSSEELTPVRLDWISACRWR